MDSENSYARSRIKRTMVGVVVAGALLGGAWHISNGAIPAHVGGVPGAGPMPSPSNGVLHVDVSGVRNDSGPIIGTLCRRGEVFVSGCTGRAHAKSRQGVVSLDFQGLATGDYALALYHDENDNAALELGSEGIGFSNNANLAHAAPDFEASSIKVDGLTSIRVRIRYPER